MLTYENDMAGFHIPGFVDPCVHLALCLGDAQAQTSGDPLFELELDQSRGWARFMVA
jgi:hypothetical protein